MYYIDTLQAIEKNNKRLKGSNPVLTDRRYQFERVRTLWSAKTGVFCSVDFEAWEYDHTLITEFGWSYVGWKDGVKIEEKGHFINDAAKNYWNRKYVQDYRDVRQIPFTQVYHCLLIPAQHYIGESERLKKSDFEQRIRDKIASLREFGPVFLVFHDPVQDVK